jgi:hypothetical protein
MQLARYGKTILASGVALAAATTMLAAPKPASAVLVLDGVGTRVREPTVTSQPRCTSVGA